MERLSRSARRATQGASDRVVQPVVRHRALVPVLAAGLTLRLLFLLAYHHPFFFPDSRPYVAAAADGIPNDIRPYGYSLLVKPFVGGPHLWIAVWQHLIGLALVVAGYAFLVRRGVTRWL